MWLAALSRAGKPATNYSWMYTRGEIITALYQASQHIEWLHEFDWMNFQLSAEKQVREAQGELVLS